MKQLHPALAPWLENFHATANRRIKEGFKATPTNAREFLANLTKRYVTDIPNLPYIEDDLVPTTEFQVPVRIYHPAPAEKLPVLIYYHGGGHMCGSVTVYDPICRKLAVASNHVVVAVDYRLAPENPYPAGIKDCLGVARNIWPVLDARKINYKKEMSIAGDSGGGALTATICGMTQHEPGIKVRRQVMIYPSLDYTLSQPSVEENGVGYLLQKDKLIWYFENYLAHGENWKDASPLFWEITPNMPEALVITAGFCPLRDEGVRHVENLKKAGIKVEHLELEDQIHPFINMEDLVPEACKTMYETIGAFLRKP